MNVLPSGKPVSGEPQTVVHGEHLPQVLVSCLTPHCWDPFYGWNSNPIGLIHCATQIDWVIVGGESGKNARPCDLAWIATLLREAAELHRRSLQR